MLRNMQIRTDALSAVERLDGAVAELTLTLEARLQGDAALQILHCTTIDTTIQSSSRRR